jgi:nitrous oxidase accessory protein
MKRKCLVIGIILLLVGTCIIPTIAQNTKRTQPTSRGNILYVGGNGPGNYTKIQDAIDNASDGDTVFVYAGVYYEWINIEKALTLQGQDKVTTHLDATYNYDRLIEINTSFVTIDGFTLENCYTPSSPGFSQAIWIKKRTPYSENIKISNCSITHDDKGIFFENVINISLMNCTIEYNPAQGFWGIHGMNIVIKNCSFNNNGHEMGGGWFVPGGITLEDCSLVDIQDCQFASNKGWGISFYNCTNATINQNSIRSSSWYGIYIQDINGLQISKNVISMNNYMGVRIDSAKKGVITIHDNNLSSNGHGQQDFTSGGIYLYSNITNISVTHNSFYKNNIVGITLTSGQLYSGHLTNNTFIGNKVGAQFGGGVISDNWFWNNNQIGVEFGSTYGRMTHNTIHGSETGVLLDGFGDYIIDNLISNVKCGILTITSWHNISSNTIANVSGRCISVNGSGNMVICSNNFLNYSQDPYLYRYYEPRNYWNGNYWGKSRLLPKVIIGTQIIWITKKIKPTLPAIEIDWHPAKKPYDLFGMR